MLQVVENDNPTIETGGTLLVLCLQELAVLSWWYFGPVKPHTALGVFLFCRCAIDETTLPEKVFCY